MRNQTQTQSVQERRKSRPERSEELPATPSRPRSVTFLIPSVELIVQRSKTAARAESPPAEDENVILSNMPQTLASPEDVSLFDKIKKYIDDKITYHEFLKLVNLWTQNFIDLQAFIDRAHVFIGQSPELWSSFRRVVNADEQSIFPNDPQSSQGGYGFGGMINVDNSVAENTPMLERVKPDLSGPRVKSYGPSYRKLPKSVC